MASVSYTHLDVYKRQALPAAVSKADNRSDDKTAAEAFRQGYTDSFFSDMPLIEEAYSEGVIPVIFLN